MGPGAAAAPLVEQEHLVARRVERAPMLRDATRAGAAMEEHGGLGARRATQLPVQRVPLADVEQARVVGLDGRVQQRVGRLGHVAPGEGDPAPRQAPDRGWLRTGQAAAGMARSLWSDRFD